GVRYTASGIKDLLRRIGASYHKVTGFLWKADPDEQQEFVAHYERQKAAAKRPGARRTRRYFEDAGHPLWGLQLDYACWLLVGQRFLAGMGRGRKRLNILGAYSPDAQEYLDLRLTRDNINGEQFVNLLRLLFHRRAVPEDLHDRLPHVPGVGTAGQGETGQMTGGSGGPAAMGGWVFGPGWWDEVRIGGIGEPAIQLRDLLGHRKEGHGCSSFRARVGGSTPDRPCQGSGSRPGAPALPHFTTLPRPINSIGQGCLR